jgi:hypothetical protein
LLILRCFGSGGRGGQSGPASPQSANLLDFCAANEKKERKEGQWGTATAILADRHRYRDRIPGCDEVLLLWNAYNLNARFCGEFFVCRNIKPLFNFEPPASPEEIRAASLQFVRKITGFHKPSQANEAAFFAAAEEIAESAARLLAALETSAAPKNREVEAARAKARAAVRFGA